MVFTISNGGMLEMTSIPVDCAQLEREEINV